MIRLINKTTATFLIIIIIPLLLISAISPTLHATEIEESQEETSWLKGIMLILISFFSNNFLEIEEEPDDEYITGDDDKETEKTEYKETEEDEFISEKDEKDIEREVLGFYVNWITENASSLKALQENHTNMDIIAPFWYTLNPDGSIVNRYGGHQYEAVNIASNNNVDVLPLINNNQSSNMMLVDPAIRTESVNNIIELVENHNYDGVNIDFEFIPPWTRDGYTAFIRELRQNMPSDKLVTISVFPKINVPLDLHGAFDYGALARHVDRLVIMTYDHHWSTGPAGPIAPINWVEQNIEYALEYVPAEKLLLGIANYGYDWEHAGNARDLSEKTALKIAENNSADIKWHSSFKTPYFHYRTDSGMEREVWFESGESTAFKLDLVNKYNLKGIAIWRLGNGTGIFWQNIENKLR